MRKLRTRCRNCGTLIEEGIYCSETCAREAETCPICGFWHPGNDCPGYCPICGLPVVSGNPAGTCQCQPEDFEFFLEE